MEITGVILFISAIANLLGIIGISIQRKALNKLEENVYDLEINKTLLEDTCALKEVYISKLKVQLKEALATIESLKTPVAEEKPKKKTAAKPKTKVVEEKPVKKTRKTTAKKEAK